MKWILIHGKQQMYRYILLKKTGGEIGREWEKLVTDTDIILFNKFTFIDIRTQQNNDPRLVEFCRGI